LITLGRQVAQEAGQDEVTTKVAGACDLYRAAKLSPLEVEIENVADLVRWRLFDIQTMRRRPPARCFPASCEHSQLRWIERKTGYARWEYYREGESEVSAKTRSQCGFSLVDREIDMTFGEFAKQAEVVLGVEEARTAPTTAGRETQRTRGKSPSI
jgi:hypothetical protein